MEYDKIPTNTSIIGARSAGLSAALYTTRTGNKNMIHTTL